MAFRIWLRITLYPLGKARSDYDRGEGKKAVFSVSRCLGRNFVFQTDCMMGWKGWEGREGGACIGISRHHGGREGWSRSDSASMVGLRDLVGGHGREGSRFASVQASSHRESPLNIGFRPEGPSLGY